MPAVQYTSVRELRSELRSSLGATGTCERIAIYLPNGLPAIVWCEAAKRLALPFVAVAGGSASSSLASRLEDTAASVLISSAEFSPIVGEALVSLTATRQRKPTLNLQSYAFSVAQKLIFSTTTWCDSPAFWGRLVKLNLSSVKPLFCRKNFKPLWHFHFTLDHFKTCDAACQLLLLIAECQRFIAIHHYTKDSTVATPTMYLIHFAIKCGTFNPHIAMLNNLKTA